MKNTLLINSVVLYDVCNSARPAATPSGILPIQANLKITVGHKSLNVEATNGNLIILKTVEIESEESFTFCVDAAIFCETLSTIPDQPIKIEVEFPTLTIITNKGKYATGIDDHKEFPQTEYEYPEESVIFDNDFVDGLSSVYSLVSTDGLRLALTGVLLECKDGYINFVATDSHKLGKTSIAAEDSPEFSHIIHPSLIAHLKANYKTGKIDMRISDSKICVELEDGTILQCSLIDAKYAPYQSILPTEKTGTFLVHKDTFMNALKRCQVFANKTLNQVIINVKKGKFSISSKDLDFNNKSGEFIDGKFEGDDITMGLNVKYLLNMLTLIKASHVELDFLSAHKPVVMKPAEDENTLYLVMPVVVV